MTDRRRPILDALEPHAHAMFSRQGSTWMAVVEFEAGERTETVESADDDAHRVRAVQQALYSKRTGGETLPLDGDPDDRPAADVPLP